MKNEKSCGSFIIDNDKVLVIKQKNSGNYGFPKGHVEDGESEKETVIREVKEETGVDIKIISDKRYVISYIQNDIINKEVVYYLSKLVNKDNLVKQEKEISEIMWVNIEEVENILTFDNIKKLWMEAKIDISK